eukprot:4830773-Pyramimonas_sp.AAC.1
MRPDAETFVPSAMRGARCACGTVTFSGVPVGAVVYKKGAQQQADALLGAHGVTLDAASFVHGVGCLRAAGAAAGVDPRGRDRSPGGLGTFPIDADASVAAVCADPRGAHQEPWGLGN